MMRKPLNALLLAIAATCAMRQWQYYFVVRLTIFDLLLALFIAGYALHVLVRRRIARPTLGQAQVLGVLWLIQLCAGLTYWQINPNLDPESTRQFVKGWLNGLLYAGGFTALVLYVAEESAVSPHRLLRAFLIGAFASAIYSGAEVLLAKGGFDLGRAVFGGLSRYGPDFDWSRPFYYEWDNFFRAQGFSGVNSQGLYVACAIPVLVLASPFRSRLFSLAAAGTCVAGLALTMSRTGIAALALAFLFFAALRPGQLPGLLRNATLALIPLLLLIFLFPDSARRLAGTRTFTTLQQIGAGRWEIYGPVWDQVRLHPLGHGLNQFSVVITRTDQIDVSAIQAMYPSWTEEHVRSAYANVHNNWLNWLFEGGWPLLALRLLYCTLLVRLCWRRPTPLGRVSAAVLMATMVAAFFNMALDVFQVELLFILLPLCAGRPAEAAAPSPPAPAPAAA